MNIYVGNISYSVSEAELQQAFEQYGDVKSTKLIMDRDTGRPKGFGFVEMDNDEQGNEAIENLNGAALNGRNLRVNQAKPRESRPPRREGGYQRY